MTSSSPSADLYETCEPRRSRVRRVRQGLARGARIEATRDEVRGLPVLTAEVGPADAPTVVLEGHLDVVPARAEQFEPRIDGRPALRARRLRHEGRAGGDDARHRGAARPGRGPGAARDRRRRGVRGGRGARLRPPGRLRLPRRLRDHRRADRPAHRGRGQGRAGDAARGRRGQPPTGRRRGSGDNAVLQRDRRFSQDRVATVCPAQLGAVRPPLDQPGQDLGRRRAEQGARPMRDRRRHPLSARPGPRRDPRRRAGDRRASRRRSS